MIRALPKAGRDALLPALSITLIGAAVWLVVQPHTADMAAQVFRAQLAKSDGLVVWDGQWYGGHYMPAYSVVMPLLGGLVGAWWAGAVACTAAALGLATVAAIVGGENRTATVWGAIFFSTGTLASLWCGRTTFLLGVAFAAWALAAFLAKKAWAWIPLALLTGAASPVAALFLAICGAAFLAGNRRRAGAVLAAAAITTPIVLSLLFAEGGSQPFSWRLFAPIVIGCLIALFLAPSNLKELRLGSLVYLVLAVGLFIVDTPVGGNLSRLGALTAASISALVLIPIGRTRLLAVLVPLALIWQWTAPVTDNIRVAGDPSTAASFYRPLINQLDKRSGPPGRVEVVWTRSHWESALLAPSHPLARGWERQLDRRFNASVNGPSITPQAFRNWLDGLAVRWVALPNAPLDLAVTGETALVRGGLPWLREVWRSPHWRLYEVLSPKPVAQGVARATSLGPRSVTLVTDRPGSSVVHVRWNRLWRVDGVKGCAAHAANGMTRVVLDGRGAATLSIGGITQSPSPCSLPRR